MSGHPAPLAWRAAAHAKINLGLAVTGTRPDGYHELASVFLRLALADLLTVTVGARADPDGLAITGDPECPVEDNLVLRAVGALRAAAPSGDSLPGLRIALEKRIPLAGGMAGGSTDAATALRLAAAAWGLAPSRADLERLGARLGADVAFFVGGHAAARVSGIGERIEPLPPLLDRVGVVLATPPFGMATPAVFAASDRLEPPGAAAATAVDALVASWRQGLDGPGLAARAAALRDANDLWPAVIALEPRLARLRDVLEEALRRPVLLTGSGSTLVALYPSLQQAHDAAAGLTARRVTGLEGVRVLATTDAAIEEEP